MKTIAASFTRLGRAFDAFCRGFRLQPATRRAFYIVAVVFILAAFSAVEQDARHPPSSLALPSPVAFRTAPEPIPAYLQPGRGTQCIDSYSNLQNEIFLGLSSESNKMLLFSQTCKVQRKTLQFLAGYPRDQRDEVLAGLFDAAARK